jgi:hypothetical protein
LKCIIKLADADKNEFLDILELDAFGKKYIRGMQKLMFWQWEILYYCGNGTHASLYTALVADGCVGHPASIRHVENFCEQIRLHGHVTP